MGLSAIDPNLLSMLTTRTTVEVRFPKSLNINSVNISSQEKRTTAQPTIWGTTATWATITLWGDHSDMSDHGVKK